MANKILRFSSVQSESGYPRSTLYLRISQKLWPKPIKLGPRSIGWCASEVVAMNDARIMGMTDEEIRSLVLKLEAARKLPRQIGEL